VALPVVRQALQEAFRVRVGAAELDHEGLHADVQQVRHLQTKQPLRRAVANATGGGIVTAAFRYNPCGCGCGLLAQGKFCRGHNHVPIFAPAGMTPERALQIACDVFDAASPVLQLRWLSRMRRDL
jgi:hypothetical protein